MDASPAPPGTFFTASIPAHRLRRLLVGGALALLCGQEAATHLTAVTRAGERFDRTFEHRTVIVLDMAHTLLDTGRLYSLIPARVRAVTRSQRQEPLPANTHPTGRLHAGMEAPWIEVGPWLELPEDATPVLAKEFDTYDTGLSLLVAATWKLLGERSRVTAAWWVVPLDVLVVLGSFVVGRRLGNTWTGLAAAALVAGFDDPLRMSQVLWPRSFPLYTALALVALVVLSRGRRPVLLGLLAGLIIGLSNEVRSTVGLVWVPLAFGVIWRFGWRSAARWIGACLLMMLVIALPIRAYQARHSERASPGAHERWFSLLIGLGDYPNPYGFRGSDSAGVALVLQRNPAAVPYDDRFLATARELWIEAVRADPHWYASILWKRARTILLFDRNDVVPESDLPGIAFRLPPHAAKRIMTVLAFIGVGVGVWRRDAVVGGAALIFAYFFAVPVLSLLSYHPWYYTPATLGGLLFVPIGALHVARGGTRVVQAGMQWRRAQAWRANLGPTVAQAGQLLARWLRPVAVAALVGLAAWSLWTHLSYLVHPAPAVAEEGYAVAFATGPAAARPLYTPLTTLPQGYAGPPLPPLMFRFFHPGTWIAPLALSRGVALLGGLALAAATAALAGGWSRARAPAVLAGLVLLAAPALRFVVPFAPEVVWSAALCVWSLVLVQHAGRSRATLPVAAGCWALATLCTLPAFLWGLALLGVPALQGRPRRGVATVLLGAAGAVIGWWGLAGPEGFRQVFGIWAAHPLPLTRAWLGGIAVLRIAPFLALAGLLARAGTPGTPRPAVLLLALGIAGLGWLGHGPTLLYVGFAVLVAGSVGPWLAGGAAAGWRQALIAGCVLLQAGQWVSDPPRPPGDADRAAVDRTIVWITTTEGPVLIEQWYAFAVGLERPVQFDDRSLPAMTYQSGGVPVALVDALERRRFAAVLYTGDGFSKHPAVRRALLSHYKPAESVAFLTALGPRTCTLFRPRADPAAYVSPLLRL